jgi:hypothetical protein
MAFSRVDSSIVSRERGRPKEPPLLRRKNKERGKPMSGKWRPYIAAAICAIAAGQAWGQAPQYAILDIEWENSVAYIDDLTDPSRLVTSPSPVATTVRNFMQAVAIADIVSVNGRPARGSWVYSVRVIQLFPNPAPGQAVGDLGRAGIGDVNFEILESDGTRIGSIMASGFGGGSAPPGLPAGGSNFAVVGGTGAFLGIRGAAVTPPGTPGNRNASMQEDPANRRTHGGNRGHYLLYLIPTFWPEIVTTASGPAVFHSDFSLVTPTRPARAGETLILRATGLGPTRPGLAPGAAFPESSFQEVNSPVDVTIEGKPAEVLNKIGWPGTTDTYRLDIRVPDGIARGIATLQVTAAFISGRGVSVRVE